MRRDYRIYALNRILASGKILQWQYTHFRLKAIFSLKASTAFIASIYFSNNISVRGRLPMALERGLIARGGSLAECGKTR